MVDVIKASLDITLQYPFWRTFEHSLARMLKICSHASFALLPLLKPKEIVSPVVSATGSRARAYKVCIARSYIVGIPRGRFLFLHFLAMYTRLSGLERYLRSVRRSIAFIFDAEVDQSFLSTPDVFFPLFVVTFLTASAFTEKEWVSKYCNRLILLLLPSAVALAIRVCSLLTSCSI